MTYQEYKTEYRITLDHDQDKACAQTEGHVLLLAVPGSGKTTVMTARLGYLVRGLGVPPDAILAVTYSVAGAREMKNRFERLFGPCGIEIRTINGYCAKIIGCYERLYRRKAFRLLENEGEVSRILREIMRGCGGFPSENEVRDVRTAVTYCRNQMLTEQQIADAIHIEGRDFPEIYRLYRRFKIENRLMDYDDQLSYGYHILCRCPEVNRAYAGRFRYVCVDEAQDTSKLQHMILRKAAEVSGNLFMVGDEDQSIYGFRAAYPEGLLEFDRLYPDASVGFIVRNYRSSGTIVAAADRFIAANTERRMKHMFTENDAGEPIRRTELSDLRELPAYLCNIAASAGEKGKIAVLCRLNDSLIPLIDALSAAGLPFSVRDGDGLFFTHYIVTDLIDILRFASDPFDPALFERLYYKFSAGVGRNDFEYALRHNVGREMLSYPEYLASCPVCSEQVRKRMRRVADVLFRINSADSYEAMRLIIDRSGYGSYLAKRSKDVSKVNTMLALADRMRDKTSFFRRLGELAEVIRRGSESKDGIILSTIHSAKGMEFDHVILCDARNGILPSVTEPADGKGYSEEERKQREEDRRLFYVGVTRAIGRLELVTYRKAFGEDCGGWEFVSTLLGQPEKKPSPAGRKKEEHPVTEELLSSFSVGDEVFHKAFGDGVIIGKRGSFAEIRFFRLTVPKRIDLAVCLEKRLLRRR